MIKLYARYCLIALFCFLAGCQGPITVTQQGTKEEIASERKKQTESSLRQEIKDLATDCEWYLDESLNMSPNRSLGVISSITIFPSSYNR